MNVSLFLKCQAQIGLQGAIAIDNGNPKESDGYILFVINNVVCCWGIDTDPVLLQNCDDDKEFQTFEDLIMELLPH